MSLVCRIPAQQCRQPLPNVSSRGNPALPRPTSIHDVHVFGSMTGRCTAQQRSFRSQQIHYIPPACSIQPSIPPFAQTMAMLCPPLIAAVLIALCYTSSVGLGSPLTLVASLLAKGLGMPAGMLTVVGADFLHRQMSFTRLSFRFHTTFLMRASKPCKHAHTPWKPYSTSLYSAVGLS